MIRWLTSFAARRLAAQRAELARDKRIAKAMQMRRDLGLPPYPGFEREQGA